MADFTLSGNNRYLLPGTYTIDDTVTFTGTAGRDILFGGGGEGMTTFRGTAGNDLYGVAPVDVEQPDWYLPLTVVDYGLARCAVYVDMTRDGGTRTFVDEQGESRTVQIVGMARDGFGGTDRFAAMPIPGNEGFSSIFVVIGSGFSDTMLCGYTGANGGAGNDRLSGAYLSGDAGNDFLWGTDDWSQLVGGDGNDRIFARGGNDDFVTGNEGDDYVDGGTGNDLIDGGVGADILVSGSGSDRINPDVEYFQSDPDQPTDGARDVIRVTRADLGAYRDTVFYNAFEEGLDQVRFGDAVRGGADFRVYQEEIATLPGRVNTVLQIDWNGDGFGGDVPDADDYFLVVHGADLSLHHDYLLT